ncbi:unnamed protein product [Dracunculus medinensis]|uniref:ZP domain-containing protein n=1 Tax=Dracunculus medinensis TaxID=318479 RepID=A0A3P7SJK3_DRAME|nr:unnamed protein product [Dracunculus medinensis]
MKNCSDRKYCNFIDTPTVTCGPEKISIEGRSEDLFEGVIFVKNWRRINGCSVNYTLGDNSTNPKFSIALNKIAQCGLELRRNADSKDLEIFAIFVFSFHPNFVTAGDRSFAVQCIFLQQQITVATKFNFISYVKYKLFKFPYFHRRSIIRTMNFSDISTKGIIGATAEMPSTQLTIVEGRIPDQTLQPAHTVMVGQQLMYIWHMPTSSEIYGFRVKECFAEAKDGRKTIIIEDSCSIDPLIVSHVKYSESLDKAFADGLAFKFPDADDLWITCMLQICLRKFEHLTIHSNNLLFCTIQPVKFFYIFFTLMASNDNLFFKISFCFIF